MNLNSIALVITNDCLVMVNLKLMIYLLTYLLKNIENLSSENFSIFFNSFSFSF